MITARLALCSEYMLARQQQQQRRDNDHDNGQDQHAPKPYNAFAAVGVEPSTETPSTVLLLFPTVASLTACERFSNIRSQLPPVVTADPNPHLALDCFIELSSAPAALLRLLLLPPFSCDDHAKSDDSSSGSHKQPRLLRVSVLWFMGSTLASVSNNNSSIHNLGGDHNSEQERLLLLLSSLRQTLRDAGITRVIMMIVAKPKEVTSAPAAAAAAAEDAKKKEQKIQALKQLTQIGDVAICEVPSSTLPMPAVQHSTERLQQLKLTAVPKPQPEIVGGGREVKLTQQPQSARNSQQQQQQQEQQQFLPRRVATLSAADREQQEFVRSLHGELIVVIAQSHEVAYDLYLKKMSLNAAAAAAKSAGDDAASTSAHSGADPSSFHPICLSACVKDNGAVQQELHTLIQQFQKQQCANQEPPGNTIVVASLVLSANRPAPGRDFVAALRDIGTAAVKQHFTITWVDALDDTKSSNGNNHNKNNHHNVSVAAGVSPSDVIAARDAWRKQRSNDSSGAQAKNRSRWCQCRNSEQARESVFGGDAACGILFKQEHDACVALPCRFIAPSSSSSSLSSSLQPLRRGTVRAVILDVATLQHFLTMPHRSCCLQVLLQPLIVRGSEQHKRNRHQDFVVIVLASSAAEFEAAMQLVQDNSQHCYLTVAAAAAAAAPDDPLASPVISIFGSRSSVEQQLQQRQQQPQQQKQSLSPLRAQQQKYLTSALLQAHSEIPFDVNKCFVLGSKASSSGSSMSKSSSTSLATIFDNVTIFNPTHKAAGDDGRSAAAAAACASSWERQYHSWRHSSMRSGEAVRSAAKLIAPEIVYWDESREDAPGGDGDDNNCGVVEGNSHHRASSGAVSFFTQLPRGIGFRPSGVCHYVVQIGKIVSSSPRPPLLLMAAPSAPLSSKPKARRDLNETLDEDDDNHGGHNSRSSSNADASPLANSTHMSPSAQILLAPMVFGPRTMRRELEKKNTAANQQQPTANILRTPSTTAMAANAAGANACAAITNKQPHQGPKLIFARDTIRSGRSLFDNRSGIRRGVVMDSDDVAEAHYLQKNNAAMLAATVSWKRAAGAAHDHDDDDDDDGDGNDDASSISSGGANNNGSSLPSTSISVWLAVCRDGGILVSARCSMCSVTGHDPATMKAIIRREIPMCRHLAASWFELRRHVFAATPDSEAQQQRLWPVAAALPIASGGDALQRLETQDETVVQQSLLRNCSTETIYLWFAVATCAGFGAFCRSVIGLDDELRRHEKEAAKKRKGKHGKKNKNGDDEDQEEGDDAAATKGERAKVKLAAEKINDLLALTTVAASSSSSSAGYSTAVSFRSLLPSLAEFHLHRNHAFREEDLDMFLRRIAWRALTNAQAISKTSGILPLLLFCGQQRQQQQQQQQEHSKQRRARVNNDGDANNDDNNNNNEGSNADASLPDHKQRVMMIREEKSCIACAFSVPARDYAGTEAAPLSLVIRRSVIGAPSDLHRVSKQGHEVELSLQRLIVSPEPAPCETCKSRETERKLSIDSHVKVFFLRIQCPLSAFWQEHSRQAASSGANAAAAATTTQQLFHMQVNREDRIDFANNTNNNNDAAVAAANAGVGGGDGFVNSSDMDPLVQVCGRSFRLTGFLKEGAEVGNNSVDECGVLAPVSSSAKTSSSRTGSPSRRPAAEWVIVSKSDGEQTGIRQADALRRALTISSSVQLAKSGVVPVLTLRFEEVAAVAPAATTNSPALNQFSAMMDMMKFSADKQ